MNERVKIGLVGTGYWGKNLLRNFVNCSLTKVTAVCDANTELAQSRIEDYENIEIYSDINTMLNSAEIDAVAIATPVRTHYQLALAALDQGKHVLIEKPIALNYEQATELVTVASTNNLTLMCDHTFCYSGPVRSIRTVVESGILGDILAINSTRTNLGLFQKDVNVLWDLAPHDLSICEYVLGDTYVPVSVRASGAKHPDSPFAADAHLHVQLENNINISIHNSWLAPTKTRQFSIIGTEKMLLWDDLSPTDKVKICHKNMKKDNDTFIYTDEGTTAPAIDMTEPLLEVANDFARCVMTGEKPVAPGTTAAQIVQILELADQCLDTAETMEISR
jgi:predicted dehydrogenase